MVNIIDSLQDLVSKSLKSLKQKLRLFFLIQMKKKTKFSQLVQIVFLLSLFPFCFNNESTRVFIKPTQSDHLEFNEYIYKSIRFRKLASHTFWRWVRSFCFRFYHILNHRVQNLHTHTTLMFSSSQKCSLLNNFQIIL